jgi:hypothetical protein
MDKKKLYYQLSDNCDVSKIVMQLSGTMEWIKNDEYNVSADDDQREYTITLLLYLLFWCVSFHCYKSASGSLENSSSVSHIGV